MSAPSEPSSSSGARRLVSFLRACYESDNREMAIANLLNASVRHLRFLDGEEHLLRDLLLRVPVDREYAIAAQKEAHLHQREKTLLYCAFPIVGRMIVGGRRARTLCAPLLFYPARLIIDETAAFVEADIHNQRVNTPILNALLALSNSRDASLDELLKELPRAPLKASDVQLLVGWLQGTIPQLDALALTQFPKLLTEKEVREAVRSNKTNANRLECIPACALGLAPNSPETRGVLYELREIAKADSLSQPLQAAIRGASLPDTKRSRLKHRVPAVLSEQQRRALHSAAIAPLSLVVGPPGTGKSYTIAATAIDHLSRGESVLVACRTQQAVDVIGDMIDRLLGPNHCVIRGAEGQNQPELKEFLEQTLQGIQSLLRTHSAGDRRSKSIATRELEDAHRKVAKLEAAVVRHLETERRWGELGEQNENWFWRKVNFYRRGMLARRLASQQPIWERTQRYQSELLELEQLTRDLLKQGIEDRIAESLKKHRRDLTTFLKSLRTRSSTRQEELFAEVDPRVLFGAFPIWLAAIPEISGIVPLSQELFDVAIIDEATQCDMASCLPIFQRAKRAVVVGDPQQLRHVSFLSNERMNQLGDEFELNSEQRPQFHYRNKSILDLLNDTIASQDHVHFLNEHFRSMPQIIQFSNEQFYGNGLSVMRLTPETELQVCVFPVLVSDAQKLGGTNEREAEAVVQAVCRLVESQSSLAPGLCQSIGVLSPFRDQVDLLAKLLEKHLSLEAFERHQLRVGTAHAFQGDERDVMYLSLTIDAESHSASLRFMERQNLLNVTITRARHLLYVFHSMPIAELPPNSLLRRYLALISRPSVDRAGRLPVSADRFMQELQGELLERRFQLWPEYELAGQHIDLIAGRDGRMIGIDLVGFPGQYGVVLDLERYRVLRRAGFALMPLPYSKWQQDRDSCLLAIESLLPEA